MGSSFTRHHREQSSDQSNSTTESCSCGSTMRAMHDASRAGPTNYRLHHDDGPLRDPHPLEPRFITEN